MNHTAFYTIDRTCRRTGMFFGRALLIGAVILISGCQPRSGDEADSAEEDTTATDETTKENVVIDIVTESMDFQLPDTIPSGWISFRYVNKSNEVHFFVLEKMPEGKTLEDSEAEVVPVFQEGMDRINEGKPEESAKAFEKLPPWFYEVVFSGGSGLVSPGGTSFTTLRLDPGYYVIECYVKMPNGMFHSAMGMIEGLVVSDEVTSLEEPAAAVHIQLSAESGIVYDKAVRSGRQTFAVHFADQKVHENFVGHDLHLVRIGSTDKLFDLENWMNWADPEGLISPAPEGLVFLGGVNDMPAGKTGYFTAELQPGLHAFVSEVPNAMSKNLLKVFAVE